MTSARHSTRELSKIERDLEKLVQALIDGIPTMAVKAKMETLEARKAELETRLEHAPEQKPALHTGHGGDLPGKSRAPV